MRNGANSCGCGVSAANARGKGEQVEALIPATCLLNPKACPLGWQQAGRHKGVGKAATEEKEGVEWQWRRRCRGPQAEHRMRKPRLPAPWQEKRKRAPGLHPRRKRQRPQRRAARTVLAGPRLPPWPAGRRSARPLGCEQTGGQVGNQGPGLARLTPETTCAVRQSAGVLGCVSAPVERAWARRRAARLDGCRLARYWRACRCRSGHRAERHP